MPQEDSDYYPTTDDCDCHPLTTTCIMIAALTASLWLGVGILTGLYVQHLAGLIGIHFHPW